VKGTLRERYDWTQIASRRRSASATRPNQPLAFFYRPARANCRHICGRQAGRQAAYHRPPACAPRSYCDLCVNVSCLPTVHCGSWLSIAIFARPLRRCVSHEFPPVSKGDQILHCAKTASRERSAWYLPPCRTALRIVGRECRPAPSRKLRTPSETTCSRTPRPSHVSNCPLTPLTDFANSPRPCGPSFGICSKSWPTWNPRRLQRHPQTISRSTY